MTIAHPPRTDATSGPRTTTGAKPSGTDAPTSRPCRHQFLLLTQDLPGRHTTVPDLLRPVVAARRGGWVGYSPTARSARATYHDEVCTHPVTLSRADINGHVVGQCATSIAAVYLNAVTAPSFDTAWAATYRSVNTRYARKAADLAAIGSVVLIVGHQLQLVAGMLRQHRPDLLIAFFLDLPFPSGDVFRRMPLHRETLDGFLGADLVGFQTARSADNFRRLALDDADIQLGRGGLDVDGRPVAIGVFPQSVDASAMRSLVTRTGVHDRVRAVRAGLGDPTTVLLAVDDLDAAAGIEQRLAAYELMLDRGEVDPRHTVLVQVVRPDPLRGQPSRELRARIERRVGLINDRHGQVGRPALHYQHRAPDLVELTALYRAADVLWATPLQAETSIVAKEYVAARTDNSGAVILSRFRGAAGELTGADQANPYDVDDLRQTVLRVLRNAANDRRHRMATMRRHVHTHDVHHWAGSLLAALGQNATARRTVADPR